MNRILKGVIAGSLLLVGAANANAGTIFFTDCLSSCSNIGALDGAVVSSVATLSFVNNGSGGVDFTLTNTIGNLYAGNTSAYLFRVGFNIASDPTDITFVSAGDVEVDAFNDAGVSLDVDGRFPTSNAGGARITNNESVTWTFTGFDETKVLFPAFIHINSLPNGGSVKLVGSSNIVEEPFPVPEPGMLVLLGSALMGLALGRKRKAKA